jgi:acetylornithine deacetylase
VDPVNVIDLTRAMVDVDSTTGREGAVGRWLADYLRSIGYTVREQVVDGDRFNVFAMLDAPRVVFSTHFDCVPPFFPSRLEGDRLFGRGACDAKGILAAQIAAAARLHAGGVRNVGLLFVVGEERGSDGAIAANQLPEARGCRYLINGEPTDNRLGIATRGVLRLRLKASGRAAHTSHPELGESAIEKLIDAIVQMRTVRLPADETLGVTHYTVGLIEGGIAPNVVPPAASAEVLFRSVGPGDDIRTAILPLERLVSIEEVLEVPPVRMVLVPGIEAAVFPYTTDIPFFTNWGQPLLYGPGSVLVAHTADEYISAGELDRAVNDYESLARQLLTQG